MNTVESRKAYSRVGFAMTGVLVLDFGLVLAAGWLCTHFGYAVETGSWLYYLVTSGPLYLIAMPLAAVWIARIPKAQGVIARYLTGGQFWIIACICIAVMYAGSLAGTLVTSLIGLLTGSGMKDLVGEMMGQSNIWVSLVMTVIVAPIAEELFFRKLLIDRLRGYGQRAALVVSASAFGLFHGNFSQVFYAFALGLAFGYIYLKTNRVGYTIALHMMINIVGGMVAIIVRQAGDMAQAAYGMLLLAAIITGIVLFFRHRKRINFSDEQPVLQSYPGVTAGMLHVPETTPPCPAKPRLAWKKPAFLNVGMILFFIFCAVLFVWNTLYALQ